MRMMKEIPVWHDVTAAQFEDEIRPLGEPAVLKGLVSDWPIVAFAREGDRPLIDYLCGIAGPQPVPCVHAEPEIEGRFHYSEDLRRPNFAHAKVPLGNFLAQLLAEAGRDRPVALAAQGLVVPECLPGFLDRHRLSILPDAIVPRMWIGNAIKVATHNDPLENVACVAAGRRRFTVFPPEQLGNLYIGPFHYTPAGTPVSMVHVTKPDPERYPRFADALDAAQSAELEPGDAIYLPYQWYHHVESLDAVNVLVNYWWNPARQDLGSPWDAMLHAMMSVRNLPREQRRAWRAAFDHYVFLENGDPGSHLPDYARGVMAADSPQDIDQMRQSVIQKLTEDMRKRR
jgi:hypothetical protein